MNTWTYAFLFLPVLPAIWSLWRWVKVYPTFSSESRSRQIFSLFALSAMSSGLIIYAFWVVFASFSPANDLKLFVARFCVRTSPLICFAGILLAMFGDMRVRVPIIISALSVELAWFLIAAATM